MAPFWLSRLFPKSTRPVTRQTRRKFTPAVESLGDRVLPAVASAWDAAAGWRTAP